MSNSEKYKKQITALEAENRKLRNILSKKEEVAFNTCLKPNQYKQKKTQEFLKLAYLEWDITTDKTFFSAQIKELFDLTENETLDKQKFFGYLYPNDRLKINKGLEEDIYNKGSFVYEYSIQLKTKISQHLIYCELVKSNEKPVRIWGIIQDVSYLRRLESNFKQEVEEKSAVLNAIPDLIFVQDYEGFFLDVYVPDNQKQNLIASPEIFIGKKSVEILPPEIAAENIAKVKQVIRTKQNVIYEYTLKLDGKIAYFEARMAPNGEGKVLSIVREITARKQTELELIKAKMIAEESDRLKSIFLANMSHEIRTPINGIVGFGELLLQDDLPSDEKQEYFHIIEKNTRQLLRLIDDLIDISKMEANLLKVNPIEFNLNELLSDLQKVYQKEIDMSNKDITLEISEITPESNAWILIDKSRLMQVLQNLLSNAVKFTEVGEVRLDVSNNGNTYKFVVSDTGIGIPEMAQKYIFERFRRLDNPADKVYRGTGLGLSVTKGLVDLMKGDISINSQEGEGSVFTFEIPCDKVVAKQPELKAKKEWKQFNNLYVLIVEDEDTSYYYLAAILKKNGVRVSRAKTGYEAIEAVKNSKVDLILMDIQLPELNGYDATRYIKKLSPEIPIIAQTAFALADDKQKALDAGCDTYVSKPISSTILLNKMKELIP